MPTRSETTAPRKRLRDLGLSAGRFPTGTLNAITDLPGVFVGHSTIVHGQGRRIRGAGPVRTGVTAILPQAGESFLKPAVGGAFVLNGAGEMSGLIQVLEWGLIETPVLLTNTLAVGTASDACVQYLVQRHPGIGDEHDVVIPLVGECDDSFLNDIAGGHVQTEHVLAALEGARSGPVAEGSVGGGTGMVSFDLKGGIGTSSRKLPASEGGYTVGVLVMTNFGRVEDLRIDGFPVGLHLAPRFATSPKRRNPDGSIIAVLGTDAPLTSHQVSRLCKRAALGIGRTGSYAAHGSGEIVLGFSTANTRRRDAEEREFTITVLSDRFIDPLYQAVIECTEEAILNALCMAEPMEGLNDHLAPALPLDEVVALVRRAKGV